MKGFVISWFFPPINSSEGLVTFKLLKNSKIKHDVFTQDDNLSWTYNSDETELKSENIKIIKNKAANEQEWIKNAVKYFDEHYEEYNFIMTRSMSPAAHEAGLLIKAKYPEIKWIASFGDPIANNPYTFFYKESNPYSSMTNGFEASSIRYTLSPKRIIKSLIWRIRKFRARKYDPEINATKLENNVFLNADKIILNNKYQKEYMLLNKKYTSDKIIIIPHTYDLDFYPKTANKDKKIRMTYLGHLDYIRNVDLFLKAVLRLKDERKELYNKIEVNFYGNMSQKNKADIIDYQLYEKVKVNKSVKYLESLKIMKNSDLLLMFDANLGGFLDKNIFFAGKIADYMGTGNPIFAVTMLDGASADILREINANIATYSADDIYNQLVYILDKGANKLNNNKKNYNITNVVKIYDEMVVNLIEKN